MDKGEKINKGREVIGLRMRSKVHQEEVFDLMKIPVEALYREAFVRDWRAGGLHRRVKDYHSAVGKGE